VRLAAGCGAPRGSRNQQRSGELPGAGAAFTGSWQTDRAHLPLPCRDRRAHCAVRWPLALHFSAGNCPADAWNYSGEMAMGACA